MNTNRLLVLLCMVALFASGCSGSSDTASVIAQTDSVTAGSDNENTLVNDTGDASNTDSAVPDPVDSSANTSGANNEPDSVESTDETANNSNTDVAESTDATSTVVDFNITVPAYKSNALLVRVEWGDKTLNANWNVDELWTVSDEFPTNVENRLIVSFFDQNGAMILGRYEADLETGKAASQTVTVTADQFDTTQWDDDNDGIANLVELIAGSNPLVDNEAASVAPEPVLASLELVQDKTFRFSWQASSAASYYRLVEDADGVSGFTQVGDDIDAAVLQYDHRVALYRRINAKYIVQACNALSCVDSQEVFVPDSLSEAVGYIKATTENPNGFGSQVALSADGNTMASTGTAEVYVFSRVNGSWQQQANLTEAASIFTSNVTRVLSLSGNGDVLVVGAPEETLQRPEGDAFQPGDQRAGAAYLYHRENGQWIYQTRLVSNNIQGSHKFGSSVSLSTDGRSLAVGATDAYFDIDGTRETGGAVYLFEQNNGAWQQQQVVRADGGNFGSSVSFSHDGTALAVGAMHHEGSGSAYVFTRTDSGWQQQSVIKANDADANDQFGTSIAIDATGSTLAVGAPYFNFSNPSLTGPIGATYVFKKIDDMWLQEIRLNASWQGDAFGRRVALSGDGNTLMVSSQGSSNNGIGFVAAYVWHDDTWIESTKVVASNAERLDQFGRSLAFSRNGETLVVGAPDEKSSAQGINGDQTDNSGGNDGAAYLF